MDNFKLIKGLERNLRASRKFEGLQVNLCDFRETWKAPEKSWALRRNFGDFKEIWGTSKKFEELRRDLLDRG